MSNNCYSVLTALITLLAASSHAGVYADSVVDYVPGNGVNSDYMNPASALGEPSRVTSGLFGGAVDPFAPPYLNTQVVSLGDGGSLTMQFSDSIHNFPGNPFGLDFLVFGNSGFWVTNELDENFNFIGTPRTDAALLGYSEGTTQVWVSQDNITYFLLDPALAPTVDVLYPTDGSGDFQLPVDPNLGRTDFAGLSLAEIRTLYAGSGGGAGFDISWALDETGQAVFLDSVNYVRVEVTSGKSEIDAIVVVPEPSFWNLIALGALAVWIGCRRRSCKTPN